LDPLRAQTVQPPPFFEHRPKTYDMQERTLAPHASDRRAVVVVEIAMHRDSAILGKRDCLLDLASLKVPFAHRCRSDGTHTTSTDAARARRRAGRRPM